MHLIVKFIPRESSGTNPPVGYECIVKLVGTDVATPTVYAHAIVAAHSSRSRCYSKRRGFLAMQLARFSPFNHLRRADWFLSLPLNQAAFTGECFIVARANDNGTPPPPQPSRGNSVRARLRKILDFHSYPRQG